MWFRIYSDRFGSTNLTFLMVLVCFIGGLGLGSLISRYVVSFLGRVTRFRNDISVVGVIEILIGASALLTYLVDPSGIRLGGVFPYVRDSRGIFEPVFSLSLITIIAAASMLVPTILMGTTFPILCNVFRNRAVFPSELYAWNTLGACTAVLVSEFILLPWLGHSTAFQLLVVTNVLLGLAFIAVGRKRLPEERHATSAPTENSDAQSLKTKSAVGKGKTPNLPRQSLILHPMVILIAAGLSGFISGAIEVDMFRAVRFAGAITDAAMSFTSFWAILAIFLASWTVRALGRPRLAVIRFAVLGSLLAYGATWIFLHTFRGWFNSLYMSHVAANVHSNPAVANMQIYPLSASLLVLLGFTGLIVFPAYYLISLLLPTVCNMIQGRNGHLGFAYGINTLAFCLGAVLFTYAFPSVSLFYAVKVLFVFFAVGAGMALTFRAGQPLPKAALWAALVIVSAGVILVPKGFDSSFFPKDELPASFPVRAMKSNAVHTTYVVSHTTGDYLYFDSYRMSGTGLYGQRYMRLMAHLPLLAQENPKRALLICFGVGNTAAAIAAHECIDTIDIIDLNDKVYETAPEFEKSNNAVYADPRVRMIHDDGRGFMKRTDQKYDLITSEPPPPRDAGVYRLYSHEYYESVLEHLTPQGMMTQWLPTNILSGSATNKVIATFVNVFPNSLLYIGSGDQLLLLGGREPFDPAILEKRFEQSQRVQADLKSIEITAPIELLARIARFGEDLKNDVRGVPIISDTRNDLALTVTDPFDPPATIVDPKAVFERLTRQPLQCANSLSTAMNNPRVLRIVIPDYPFGNTATR
jgi:spermidine synthase